MIKLTTKKYIGLLELFNLDDNVFFLLLFINVYLFKKFNYLSILFKLQYFNYLLRNIVYSYNKLHLPKLFSNYRCT